MAYFGFIGILIVAFIAFMSLRKTFKTSLNRFFPSFLVLILIVVTSMSSLKIIPVGNVGIVFQFGNIIDQRNAGLQIVYPWQDVKLANIMNQKKFFEDLTCFSQETQDVFISLTLNFRVSPDIIQDLYAKTGSNYFDVLVSPKIQQITKDETVKYKAIDVAPNRENIRKGIKTRLQEELKPFSIEIVDVLLENITFSEAFMKAIDDKQVASQNALRELELVKATQYKAQQVVEKAKGDAEANRLLSNSLTPQIIQYTMIQKLSDKIQVIMLPSNNGLIIDPKALLNSTITPK
jgi:regulator of protease activity HflC (stomatin/prohibitin superfamily)